jgi:hypothetical protein
MAWEKQEAHVPSELEISPWRDMIALNNTLKLLPSMLWTFPATKISMNERFSQSVFV